MVFAVPAEHKMKIKENKTRDKYLDLAGELKNMEYEDDGDTNCNWCAWNDPQEEEYNSWKPENKPRPSLSRSSRILVKVQETSGS